MLVFGEGGVKGEGGVWTRSQCLTRGVLWCDAGEEGVWFDVDVCWGFFGRDTSVFIHTFGGGVPSCLAGEEGERVRSVCSE